MCFDAGARPPILPIAGGADDGREVILKSADGTQFRCYASRASKPSGAGIVVMPDVRGLHPFYEELAVRFAENGIDAIAMDYYGRTAGLGSRGDDFDWQTHVGQTTMPSTMEDVAACCDFLRSRDGGGARSLFTVGFCFGGSSSWLQAVANHNLAGAIGFYGRPTDDRPGWPAPITRVRDFKCPVLGLMGGDDPYIPLKAIEQFEEALAAAGVPHELVTYAGAPHSFFDRRQTEFAAESADAWQRILSFIRSHS